MMNMEFKITYEIKGQRRKELVQAISDYLNTIPKYLSVPTCAYEIGELTIDREGAVIIKDTMTPAEVDTMVRDLEAQGFLPTNYGENAFDGIKVSMPSRADLMRLIDKSSNCIAEPTVSYIEFLGDDVTPDPTKIPPLKALHKFR